MDRQPVWWENAQLGSVPALDEFWYQLYADYIPQCLDGSLSALEIGCFPGGFIGFIGRLGYRISGFDTHPEVEKLNPLFAADPGILLGRFDCESLDQHIERGIAYDLVISMGFIEHFEDWASVFGKHYQLCKPGGKIIIGAPNFCTPMQRALHTVLDKDNIDNHCLHAMYPLAWEGYLRALGMNVLYAGHYGPFNFWTQTHPKSVGHLLMANLVKSALPHVKQFSAQLNSGESGYSVIVATKGKELRDDIDVAGLADYFNRLSRVLSDHDEKLAGQVIRGIEGLLP